MRTQHCDGWAGGLEVALFSIPSFCISKLHGGFIFVAENKLLNSHVSNFLLAVTLRRHNQHGADSLTDSEGICQRSAACDL